MEQRDFFVSYTGEDKAWARWIADTLKSNGYTVYVQAFDIRPGDDFLEKMEKFFDNSANFIAVWSKGYAQSGFCMKEFRAAFNGLEKGWLHCLLPVRIDNHPLRRLYASLVHVDLSDMGAASEKKLMDAVHYAVPRPVTPLEDDAEALNKRGNDYYWGENGVQRDYNKAREYYEQAAYKGNVAALNSLGYLYQHSLGVQADYTKARNYYEQAAAKGRALALYDLGSLYEYGEGVKQDYAKALEYYQIAADKGYKRAYAKVEELRKKLGK